MNAPFGRLVTAMVTPFQENLEVDYPTAIALAKRLVEQKHTGLVVAGTTGESPTLSKAEKLKLFRDIKEAVPTTHIIAGTGSNDTRNTIELSKAAADTGVDALLVVSPYYNKPNQEMLKRHFLEVADASSLPLVLYNIPGRTGVEVSPDVLFALAEHPRIVAVKQSLPDVDPITDLASKLKGSGREMAIYSGDDAHTLSIMASGGCGVISVAGHFVGPQMAEMMEAFEAGNIDRAREIHLSIFPLIKGLFTTTNPVMTKAGLKLQGFPVGSLRPPLYPSSQAEEDYIGGILKSLALL
jgi:4-hydroxy-tetrahydrodipicolinate synthase